MKSKLDLKLKDAISRDYLFHKDKAFKSFTNVDSSSDNYKLEVPPARGRHYFGQGGFESIPEVNSQLD